MRITRPAFSNRPLSRRTILRGVGTAMALPYLEAMMPSAHAADVAQRPKRLQVFYTPNGMTMPEYRPTGDGANFTLPATLEPLARIARRSP